MSTTTERDAYSDAVAYLTEHPEEIRRAWDNPYTEPGGCLFMYAGTDEDCRCGCLTQIRAFQNERAATPELTAAIKADSRIPESVRFVTPSHLPVFAEWQRRIDSELGRTPPQRQGAPQP